MLNVNLKVQRWQCLLASVLSAIGTAAMEWLLLLEWTCWPLSSVYCGIVAVYIGSNTCAKCKTIGMSMAPHPISGQATSIHTSSSRHAWPCVHGLKAMAQKWHPVPVVWQKDGCATHLPYLRPCWSVHSLASNFLCPVFLFSAVPYRTVWLVAMMDVEVVVVQGGSPLHWQK